MLVPILLSMAEEKSLIVSLFSTPSMEVRASTTIFAGSIRAKLRMRTSWEEEGGRRRRRDRGGREEEVDKD